MRRGEVNNNNKHLVGVCSRELDFCFYKNKVPQNMKPILNFRGYSDSKVQVWQPQQSVYCLHHYYSKPGLLNTHKTF